MQIASQDNNGKQGRFAEYNANNSWLYNGNNGCINNNNKYNSLTVRPVRESHIATASLDSLDVPLKEWYPVYRVCKKNCGKRPLHLIFRYGWLSTRIINICCSVNAFEYVPGMAVCFMIELPRLREVIAALFDDKMVQTFYCMHVMPLLERHFLHKDSYACRKGKGGLRAVLALKKYIYDESEGYTRSVLIAKDDLKGFFMSIDTELNVRRLVEFLKERLPENPLKQILLYLTRIIYQSQPQLHCIVQSPRELHEALPEYKRMRGREGFKGVAIGNRTSQMIAGFVTTFYLLLLEALDYRFVHYTDDTTTVIRDKERWLMDRRFIAVTLEEEHHLTLHPKKSYLQHYSKGVELLGVKLRFNRMLPSDRIVHNFMWKVRRMSRRAAEDRVYLFSTLEHLQQTVNSYLGMFIWFNTYRLRTEILGELKSGPYGRYLLFPEGYRKINIKPQCTRQAHYKRKNRERKKSMKLWNMESTAGGQR
ncbi:MAG: hypothetical protein K6F96_06885 [Bacteroidales bacterium]|nr:hypothetical protein [Bacteroidales bacterium]